MAIVFFCRLELYKLNNYARNGQYTDPSDVPYWNYVNLLNPTGYLMHQQFNIQQLYVLSTLYLCVLYLSENKQRLVSFTA